MHRENRRRSSPVRSWIGAAAFCAAALPAAASSGPAADPIAGERLTLAPPSAPPTGAPAPEEPASSAAESGWSYEPTQGMRWTSDEGAVQVWLGGRLHLDWAFPSATSAVEDAFGPFVDGVQFRRARLSAEGTLYERVGFKFDYDFTDNAESDFFDAWIGLNDLAGGIDLKVGHMKEPQGLDQLTDSNYTTFMERSAAQDGLLDLRNTGAMVSDTVDPANLNWAIGVFRPTDAFGDDDSDFGEDGGDDDLQMDDSQYIVTARVAGTPLYSNEGRDVVHLGASFSYQPADDEGEYVAGGRPEDNQAPTVVEITVPADDYWTAGAEAAWVWNQLSVQSEYLLTRVDSTTGDDPYFRGFYVFASWFLTGEHRPYKPNGGVFGRVVPQSNFGEGGGGAWELAARFSRLDLEDRGWDGGRLNSFTGGVNWYLNPNARVMLNYVHGDLMDAGDAGDVDGDIDAFLVRFQVDF